MADLTNPLLSSSFMSVARGFSPSTVYKYMLAERKREREREREREKSNSLRRFLVKLGRAARFCEYIYSKPKVLEIKISS